MRPATSARLFPIRSATSACFAEREREGERETQGYEPLREAQRVVAVEGGAVIRLPEVGGACGVLVVSHFRPPLPDSFRHLRLFRREIRG